MKVFIFAAVFHKNVFENFMKKFAEKLNWFYLCNPDWNNIGIS